MNGYTEGYSINMIKADMTKPLPFENESFDNISRGLRVDNGHFDVKEGILY